MDSEPSEPIYTDPIQKELSIRGIGRIEIEPDTQKTIDIPAVPRKPATTQGNEEQFIRATENTLEELGVPKDASSKVVKMTVSFTENAPLTFQEGENIPRDEKLDVFKYEKPSTSSDNKKLGSLLIFSPGGKIHQSVIESSGYLSMINVTSPETTIVTVNHRGSHDHKEKADTSFDSREADILVALQVAKEKLTRGKDWDGRVFLMGDSMGGHVVASLSRKMDFDGLILTEPAAYGVEAQFTKWVYPDSKFPSGDKYREYLANDPLFSAKPEHLKAAGIPEEEVKQAGLDPDRINGVLQTSSSDNSPAYEGVNSFVKRNKKAKVLLISMENDAVVSDKITQGYKTAVMSGREDALVEIKTPGGHGSTTAEEIRGIADFLK